MSITCYDVQIAREIAKELLAIQAIKLKPEDPFTWASGWHSPIYCDNRLSLSYPVLRTRIKEVLAQAIRIHFPALDGIAGVATAGIPQGALVADILDVPFAYVRSKSKSHGLTNQIEGQVKKGMSVVVVEDLVSTGGSSLAAVEALRNEDVNVLGMVSIFTYGFGAAAENLDKHKVDLVYLSDYNILLEIALEQSYIQEHTLETLRQWREDPEQWQPNISQ